MYPTATATLRSVPGRPYLQSLEPLLTGPIVCDLALDVELHESLRNVGVDHAVDVACPVQIARAGGIGEPPGPADGRPFSFEQEAVGMLQWSDKLAEHGVRDQQLVAIGGNAFEDWKGDLPQVGDRVVVAKYAGLNYVDDGATYRIINDKDIAAVIS